MASEPEGLVDFFRRLGLPLTRVRLEAGPLSQWLHAGLTGAGFEAVLLETLHVKAALSAMVVKTDRKDARGIAQLLRMGWYRPVTASRPRRRRSGLRRRNERGPPGEGRSLSREGERSDRSDSVPWTQAAPRARG